MIHSDPSVLPEELEIKKSFEHCTMFLHNIQEKTKQLVYIRKISGGFCYCDPTDGDSFNIPVSTNEYKIKTEWPKNGYYNYISAPQTPMKMIWYSRLAARQWKKGLHQGNTFLTHPALSVLGVNKDYEIPKIDLKLFNYFFNPIEKQRSLKELLDNYKVFHNDRRINRFKIITRDFHPDYKKTTTCLIWHWFKPIARYEFKHERFITIDPLFEGEIKSLLI